MKKSPHVESKLRHNILKSPEEIEKASGIDIYGRKIKSCIFTTDIAIIRNCDADAIFAVYPFTPQQCISDAIIKASYVPVFCGVGGGTTYGPRAITIATDAEAYGAIGVVLNAPITNENLYEIAQAVDVPIVITVTNKDTDIQARLDAGASILNVAGAGETAAIVRKIRKTHPDVPIIASGGPTAESRIATIKAGANAITFVPPTTKELFSDMMKRYRET